MNGEILVLRLVHILCAVFWVGTTMFTTFFLLPALGSAGPAAGAVMAGLQRRRFMVVLPVTAVLTILSGLRLLDIASSHFQGAYFRSATGMAFATSAALALIAFVIGMSTVRPAAARAGALGARMATATDAERATLAGELDRARRRASSWGLGVVLLLILAAAGMAVARYLG